MKKIGMLLAIIMLAVTVCMLTSCSSFSEKLCRIEIYEADTLVKTLEKQSQKQAADFFDQDAWTEYDGTDNGLTPKYTISLYQQKTQTIISLSNEEDYDLIATYTTYENSEVVKEVYFEEAVTRGLVPKGLTTFYQRGSNKFFDTVENVM